MHSMRVPEKDALLLCRTSATSGGQVILKAGQQSHAEIQNGEHRESNR
jgi:hypothetical protein